MTIQVPDDLARGLEAMAAAQQKSVEHVGWTVCTLCWTERLHLKSYCEPFGNRLIQALRPLTISRLRSVPHGCRRTIRAPSTNCRGRIAFTLSQTPY